MTKRALVALLLLWMTGMAIQFVPASAWLHTLGWLLFALCVPGVLLATLLLPAHGWRDRPLTTALSGIGAGYVLLVIQLLLVVYLPGDFHIWIVYTLTALTTLTLAILTFLALTQRPQTPDSRPPSSALHPPTTDPPPLRHTSSPPETRALWIAAVVVVLLALLLRAPNLGYAEFHGDEARAVLRAAAILQGDESVLFLHRKGPVEVLLPAAHFAFADTTSESAARLPFLLANLGALLAALLLGWRIAGLPAGLVAALLLAVDGYYVAFARFVQYQSIVLLMAALAILALVELVQEARTHAAAPEAFGRRLTLVALLLATALLAHYDAAVALPPLLLLWGALAFAPGVGWRRLLRASLPAFVAGGAMLAAWYLPLLLQPAAAGTLAYLRDERVVGGGLPVNNLVDFVLRGFLYGSLWLLLTMTVLLAVGFVGTLLRGYGRGWGGALAGGAIGSMALLGWTVSTNPLASTRMGAVLLLIVFTLAFGLAICAPRQSVERRALWLWLAGGAVGMLFLVAAPRTHVHVFYMPWALLAGGAAGSIWQWSSAATVASRGRRAVRPALAVAAVALLLLMVGHPLTYFTSAGETLRTGSVWTWLYPRPAATAQVDGRFGVPFANGWKAIGALYADGEIAGDFETNQRYAWVPAWYTRGQFRCSETAQWWFAGDVLEPWAEDNDLLADRIQAEGFAPWGSVLVNGTPRMAIYAQGAQEVQHIPRMLDLAEFAPRFDAIAGATLPLDYPVILPTPQYAVAANFDDKIALDGYTLTPEGPYMPGQQVTLRLFWRSLASMQTPYTVFVQAFDTAGTKAAQRDSQPVCNQEPTTTWSPGDVIVDTHPLTIQEVAPGDYGLYVGWYDAATGGRLAAASDGAEVLDNAVLLERLLVE